MIYDLFVKLSPLALGMYFFVTGINRGDIFNFNFGLFVLGWAIYILAMKGGNNDE